MPELGLPPCGGTVNHAVSARGWCTLRPMPPPGHAMQMVTPSGARWWYSPILRRAALDVPPQPWGGFCAEEMGLGKVGRGP